jgi:hypothetical protein
MLANNSAKRDTFALMMSKSTAGEAAHEEDCEYAEGANILRVIAR